MEKSYVEVIYGYRNWIWDCNNWRVYVSIRGFIFEIDESITLKQAVDAWYEYYERMR
jgi:hypothetical protein